VRIASVTRIHGPHEDGQYFMVTRYDGLLGRLLGRKLFAVVRLTRSNGHALTWWGTSDDETCEAVRNAVDRFECREQRDQHQARLRGDVYWRPVEPLSDPRQRRTLGLLRGGE